MEKACLFSRFTSPQKSSFKPKMKMLLCSGYPKPRNIPHAWRDALPWGDCDNDQTTCEKLLVAQLDPSAPPSDVLVPGGRDVP